MLYGVVKQFDNKQDWDQFNFKNGLFVVSLSDCGLDP